jgi:hypothetical protein
MLPGGGVAIASHSSARTAFARTHHRREEGPDLLMPMGAITGTTVPVHDLMPMGAIAGGRVQSTT